jgi:iron(III) transport system substrate-binding protein
MRPMVRRASLFLLFPLVVAVALAGGCSSGGERITVYSGRTSELIRPLLEKFSEETGISVDFKAGDSADMALLIEQEGDSSPADVFISQTPGATAYLAANGRLQALPQEVLDLVPVEDRAVGGEWVGLSGRVRVLVYNTDEVDPATLPASVLGLTDPAYRGQVGVAPNNGSFQDFVSAMRVQQGDDATMQWLQGMADNDSPVYANNTAIVAAVGRGEIPMGLVNHYYNVRAKAEDPSIKSENHFFPNGDIGSLLIITAAGVVSTTNHSEAAERLVRFLLSEESQQYFATETDEYPLVAGVQPIAGLPSLDSLDVGTVDFDQLGAEFEGTIQMIAESGIDD